MTCTAPGLFGRTEPTTGIEPFGRLVEQVMTSRALRLGRRVFWVVDNGSSPSGPSLGRPARRRAGPLCGSIHLPVHASWLNQIEIVFSVVQRKVVTPNDFHGRYQVETRLLEFQNSCQQIATPFEWQFTKADLNDLLDRITAHELAPAA